MINKIIIKILVGSFLMIALPHMMCASDNVTCDAGDSKENARNDQAQEVANWLKEHGIETTLADKYTTIPLLSSSSAQILTIIFENKHAMVLEKLLQAKKLTCEQALDFLRSTIAMQEQSVRDFMMLLNPETLKRLWLEYVPLSDVQIDLEITLKRAMLATKHIDVNVSLENNASLLMFNVEDDYPSPEMIEFLLKEAKADVLLQDADGDTALILAARRFQHDEEGDTEKRLSIIKLLLEHGADPLHHDGAESTALDYAKETGDAQLIQLLEVAQDAWLKKHASPKGDTKNNGVKESQKSALAGSVIGKKPSARARKRDRQKMKKTKSAGSTSSVNVSSSKQDSEARVVSLSDKLRACGIAPNTADLYRAILQNSLDWRGALTIAFDNNHANVIKILVRENLVECEKIVAYLREKIATHEEQVKKIFMALDKITLQNLWIANLENVESINFGQEIALRRAMLGNKKLSVNYQDQDGYSLLMMMMQDNVPVMSDFLVAQAKADVNLKNNEGRTALMSVVLNFESDPHKKIPMMELLLSRGANPFVRDNQGKTALDYVRNLPKNQSQPLMASLQKAQVEWEASDSDTQATASENLPKKPEKKKNNQRAKQQLKEYEVKRKAHEKQERLLQEKQKKERKKNAEARAAYDADLAQAKLDSVTQEAVDNALAQAESELLYEAEQRAQVRKAMNSLVDTVVAKETEWREQVQAQQNDEICAMTRDYAQRFVIGETERLQQLNEERLAAYQETERAQSEVTAILDKLKKDVEVIDYLRLEATKGLREQEARQRFGNTMNPETFELQFDCYNSLPDFVRDLIELAELLQGRSCTAQERDENIQKATQAWQERQAYRAQEYEKSILALAAEGNVQKIQHLLNTHNTTIRTKSLALIQAALDGHEDVMELLLNAKADPLLANDKQLTPLAAAGNCLRATYNQGPLITLAKRHLISPEGFMVLITSAYDKKKAEQAQNAGSSDKGDSKRQ